MPPTTGRVAVQERGERRRRAILEAAEALLLEEGYAALSMRRVAGRAGISLGNLQHYFASKRDLLEALIAEIERLLRTSFNAAVDGAEDPEARLRTGVRLLLAHTRTPEGSLPLWDLWALAGHDEHAREVMDGAYARLRHELADLIAEANPNLAPRARAVIAATIVSLVEGTSLLVGHGKPDHRELRGLHGYVEELAIDLVRNQPRRPADRS